MTVPTVIYLFGAPGSGKTHVGRALARRGAYEFHDADRWLPSDMVATLREGKAFTPAMRDRYYATVVAQIARLRAARPGVCLAIAQATYKNRHRVRILEAFPDASLWLVSAPEALRVRRVAARGSGGSGGGGRCGGGERPPSDGAVDLAEGSRAANIEWIRKHSAGFESPHGHHPYVELINDLEGDATSVFASFWAWARS